MASQCDKATGRGRKADLRRAFEGIIEIGRRLGQLREQLDHWYTARETARGGRHAAMIQLASVLKVRPVAAGRAQNAVQAARVLEALGFIRHVRRSIAESTSIDAVTQSELGVALEHAHAILSQAVTALAAPPEIK